MTPEQFCYWLQGRAEMRPDDRPTDAEWKMIRDHLATVFVKVTPPLGDHRPAGVWPVRTVPLRAECLSPSATATC